MQIEVGDKVIVKSKNGSHEGIYMPSANKDVEVIKLDSGYNIGIDKENVTEIKVVAKDKEHFSVKVDKPAINPTLPFVSILHTGGTIASKVDYQTGGTVSRFTPEELLAMFPELKQYANIRSRLIKNMWSQDMRFEHYNLIAKEVEKELKAGAKGVIVTQGTDTMHYTSAGLAFVLEGLSSPVILVGAQRSSDRGSSDAYMNLINAVYFIAHSDFGEVGICMHENMDDNNCLILPATKSRKMHTSRRDAFRPINTLPWARVNYAGKEITYLKNDYHKAESNGSANSKLTLKLFKEDIKVAILKQTTNMYAEQFLSYKGYSGLVIESTGLGCLPITEKDESTSESGKIFDAVKTLIKNKVVVVEAPQTIYGRLVLNVYSDQRQAQEIGVVGCFSDMTPETTFIKLAWLLSNHNHDKAKELLLQNLRGEITEQTDPNTFLY
ncbi:MAG: Glu-tRNA(Gln) amidotransferase subunit GatD [Candidatus Woesearchaeota archaeon]